jgi:NhaP-type Na+/H+ or K+/H+ antiporter
MPPGWSSNPSEWGQRIPILGLALYLWGVFGTVWKPHFGHGSGAIFHSRTSKLLPIPDAALGALRYLLDAGSGVIGPPDHRRRMPWSVVVFGLAVGSKGAVSITLMILLPILFGYPCTLCLSSAVFSS